MQAFVASLTAALLFIHAVFGCCGHHAHACEHAIEVVLPATCCHHDHDEGSQHNDEPCDGKHDCEGSCIYVLPQKMKIEAPQCVIIDLLVVLPALADHRFDSASSFESLSSPRPFGPPLRPHLLHQVLLN
jgi:hypothetical protein